MAPWRRAAVALAACVAALTLAVDASAYCRLRTCDPNDASQDCDVDGDGCVQTGAELFWASSCVTFAVQEAGSPLRGIDADSVEEIATRAFRHWLNSDCDGARPSIQVGSAGSVTCSSAEYNSAGRNANIVLFRDDEWPYDNTDAYAYTKLHFDESTGEIFDADIAINTAEFAISSDPAQGIDLESVLTHEIGHFFGLGHARAGHDDATMSAGWNGEGTALRSLSADDEAGLCAIYPPERAARTESCEPRHGFASECGVPLPEQTRGCSFVRRPTSGWPVSLAAAFLPLLLRRRRVTRSSRCSHSRPLRTSCVNIER